MTSQSYDLAIIGGGPAGLSALLYASRMNIRAKLFEAEIIGGQMIKTESIDNYIGAISSSPEDILEKMTKDLDKYNAEYEEFAKISDLKKIDDLFHFTVSNDMLDESHNATSKSVLITTGTKHNELDAENHDIFVESGISYCAVCDAPFYAGQNTLVVGGGDSALEAAILLAESGSRHVTLLYRKQLRAKEYLIRLAEANDKIHFKVGEIASVNSNSHLVESATLKSGETLEVGGIFPCIGSQPTYDFINKELLSEMHLAKNSYAYSNQPVDGLYLAGDLTNPLYRQVAIAVGEGAKSALEIYNYLQEKR